MTDDEIKKLYIDSGGHKPASWDMKFARLIEQRTIERCAEVCEELDYPNGYEYASGSKQAGFDEAREDCAAAIRALKEKP
jgi:hypothetical protein